MNSFGKMYELIPLAIGLALTCSLHLVAQEPSYTDGFPPLAPSPSAKTQVQLTREKKMASCSAPTKAIEKPLQNCGAIWRVPTSQWCRSTTLIRTSA